MNWFRVKSRAVGDRCCWRWPWCCCSGPTSSWTSITPPNAATCRPAEVFDLARNAPSDATLAMVIKGTTLEGDEIVKTVAVQLGDGRRRRPQAPGRGRPATGAAGRQRADRRGQVRLARQARRLRTRLGRGRGQGAHRRAQPALVLPAGAAAGGAGVVEPGAPAARCQRPLHARLHCASSGESRGCPAAAAAEGAGVETATSTPNAQAKGLASASATGRSSLERGWL